jgi:hypothetical protein
MIVNQSAAYSAMTPVLEQIREDAVEMKRMRVNVRNLLPGDMFVGSGKVVRQMFDHIFGEDLFEKATLQPGRVLVQFGQVTGLSVVNGDDLHCVEIFRPVQES